LRGRDFSFDPRTLEMRAESGGGQHGMTFDNQGRKFVCSNSDHIQQIVYEDRYAARNSFYTMPSPRVSIAVDGPAAEGVPAVTSPARPVSRSTAAMPTVKTSSATPSSATRAGIWCIERSSALAA